MSKQFSLSEKDFELNCSAAPDTVTGYHDFFLKIKGTSASYCYEIRDVILLNQRIVNRMNIVLEFHKGSDNQVEKLLKEIIEVENHD